MSNMSQKDAVYSAVTNVCGVKDVAYNLTKEQRASVNQILFEGFKNGSVVFSGSLPEDSDLKAYVSGLQSNWLRKDKRLNGGFQYQAKNPGSRTGSTDPQIKAMRALLATRTDEAERAEIQAFIDARMSQIKPSKAVSINVTDLPTELQHLVK